MKRKVLMIVKFVIGMLLMATAIITYMPAPRRYLIELTFLSNLTIGFVFVLSGIRMARGKKDLPNVIYETAVVTILLMFGLCDRFDCKKVCVSDV